MENQNKPAQGVLRLISYILVAALASCATYFLSGSNAQPSKLSQLQALIEEYFVGETDSTLLTDAAAAAMVSATKDKWSYYIPASQYDAHMEQMKNAYVGIGVTISTEDAQEGFLVQQVEPGGGAAEAGIRPGDILVEVEGQSVLQIGLDAAGELIRGDENTQVQVVVLRESERLEFSVTRRTIQVVVAQGQMLPNNIGLVSIANFDERCADETLAAIGQLLEQGAQALIFDVRFNPGGYKTELVKVLDYLLPEGPLFRSETYNGVQSVSSSDADCLELPMAVLINESSYSAAEFFAAALNEYDWAVVVGEPTTGKGYFQNTFRLIDGSAVGLSVGKYYTPNGVSLADEGGLIPEIQVDLDDETKANIYAGMVDPAEDPQIQAAIAALKEGL